MYSPHTDIDFLRKMLDFMEAERMRNTLQDKRLKKIGLQVEQLDSRLGSVEMGVSDLQHRVDRGEELEYLENPYSLDGSPRCNYPTKYEEND